ncbi:hypothetical protein TanjilG_24997 [Lupinus angustifolius]|uniref:Uncharacterized protein n=1 Tax=Lupinus angustifolius TaxID=3871 RepID=A0A1J7I8K7_LUPAN|nr:hypothetical protein TanjilG_24997 [Lupinus angustifolius]
MVGKAVIAVVHCTSGFTQNYGVPTIIPKTYVKALTALKASVLDLASHFIARFAALCKFLRTLATHTVNSGTKIQDCSLPVLVEYKMAEKLVMHVKADILQGDAMGDLLQKNSDLLLIAQWYL